PHGRPLRPADRRPRRGQGRGDRRGGSVTRRLFAPDQPGDDVIVKGARVLDPAASVDQTIDVRVDKGVVAELGTDLATNGHRVVDGEGLVLAPAFVDPDVHLRTTGRDAEHDLGQG